MIQNINDGCIPFRLGLDSAHAGPLAYWDTQWIWCTGDLVLHQTFSLIVSLHFVHFVKLQRENIKEDGDKVKLLHVDNEQLDKKAECVCVNMYYSCCGDINLFTHSHCGDSPSFWGQSGVYLLTGAALKLVTQTQPDEFFMMKCKIIMR